MRKNPLDSKFFDLIVGCLYFLIAKYQDNKRVCSSLTNIGERRTILWFRACLLTLVNV